MTQATPTQVKPPVEPHDKIEPVRLSHRIDPSAVATLFKITVAQLVRGKRLIVLGLLFALPTLFALLARYYNDEYRAEEAEEVLVFYLIPQALVPLTALVFASGMIRDEIEDQTLTYLLIRPLPRWAVYLAKLLAVLAVAVVLTTVFTTIAFAAIHWGAENFWSEIMPGRALRASALSALALLAYVSLFGCLSLFLRWTLVVGVAYIVVFEGVFANIDFLVRRLTILWYVRVLAERRLGLHVASWSIDLNEAPSDATCLMTLLGIGAVATILAAVVFTIREFRVKTPEGN